MNVAEPLNDAALRQEARALRLRVLDMVNAAGSSHVGTCFSMIELLVVLYWRWLRVDPAAPEAIGRDRFILSKGHGCAALYAVLAARGFFPRDWLDSFYQNGGKLAGHATHKGVPGVEISTGSLGHGLPIAVGMALAGRTAPDPFRVVTLLSDGECDEGTIWEAALFAGHHKLDNLVAIVDYNKIQSLGAVNEVMDLEPFADKWRAFGWAVTEVDGHDFTAINAALATVPSADRRPSCIIAHTVKGKGVSFMENTLLWHYRTPRDSEYDAARAELELGA